MCVCKSKMFAQTDALSLLPKIEKLANKTTRGKTAESTGTDSKLLSADG